MQHYKNFVLNTKRVCKQVVLDITFLILKMDFIYAFPKDFLFFIPKEKKNFILSQKKKKKKKKKKILKIKKKKKKKKKKKTCFKSSLAT